MASGAGTAESAGPAAGRLLRRFAERYTGDADPADALFWLDHPGETGPSGAPSPDDAIRALRMCVYRREPSSDDVAALAEAVAHRDRERALAVAALAAAVTESVHAAPTGDEAAPHAAVPAVRRAIGAIRSVSPKLGLAAVAAAVVGAVGGAAAIALPAAAPAAAAPLVLVAPALSVRADPAVLSRPVDGQPVPLALVGPDLVARSFRRLAAYPAAAVSLWGAKDRFGNVCLVAADTYYRVACVDPETFTADGLVLTWSAGPGYPTSTTRTYTAVWRDGRLTAGRTPS